MAGNAWWRGHGESVRADGPLGAERPRDEPPGQPKPVSRRNQHPAGRVGSIELLGAGKDHEGVVMRLTVECGEGSHESPRPGRYRPLRYAPGGRYCTWLALVRAAMVSSTVRRTVVSRDLSAPPAPMARETAAIETLSGASQ